jgi:hypothetical protein
MPAPCGCALPAVEWCVVERVLQGRGWAVGGRCESCGNRNGKGGICGRWEGRRILDGQGAGPTS